MFVNSYALKVTLITNILKYYLFSQDYLPPASGSANEAAVVDYDDEFQAYADMIRSESDKFKQRVYTRPKMAMQNDDGRKSVSSPLTKQTEYEEYSVQDQVSLNFSKYIELF